MYSKSLLARSFQARINVVESKFNDLGMLGYQTPLEVHMLKTSLFNPYCGAHEEEADAGADPSHGGGLPMFLFVPLILPTFVCNTMEPLYRGHF